MLLLAGTGGARAGSVQYRISRKDLHRLIERANKASDYQALAAYFRYREQIYRAKALATMDDYVQCVHPVPEIQKVRLRADADVLLAEFYSQRAERQSQLARSYEDRLIEAGGRPAGQLQTVSLQALAASR